MLVLISTYAGKNTSTETLRRVVEKRIGKPMNWFFNQWVYGKEIPDYDFNWMLREGSDGKTLLQLSLKQAGVSDSFEMRVLLYTELNGHAQRLGFVRIRGSVTGNHEVVLPFRPDKAMLDEFHNLLCTTH